MLDVAAVTYADCCAFSFNSCTSPVTMKQMLFDSFNWNMSLRVSKLLGIRVRGEGHIVETGKTRDRCLKAQKPITKQRREVTRSRICLIVSVKCLLMVWLYLIILLLSGLLMRDAH